MSDTQEPFFEFTKIEPFEPENFVIPESAFYAIITTTASYGEKGIRFETTREIKELTKQQYMELAW